MTVHYSRSPW